MDKIHLLPDSVANQIAAGEVIQRPASVIKELVENAVDAGAKTIQVLVVDAGKTSIQVVDDGCGMSVTDARLAFERHATSKIKNAEDLFTLTTMGFRGEALPSIAAIAQVTLTSRPADAELGIRLHIEGSRVTSQEPVNCPHGSNFKIENIFYNVPARRRFLKTNKTELNNIIDSFQRIVLVYPEITFTLYSNGQELYNLHATNLHQRILDVFGKKLNQLLLPFEVETMLGNIHGFTGKPEAAHKKGVQQYFFVNGRYMRHPYFQKAVLAAYDRLIPVGEQVPFFIYFDMKPEDIDVNVHPTKTEIKFTEEQDIWKILNAAVRDAVGRFCDIPSIDFDTEGKPDIPVITDTTGTEIPEMNYDPQYNPFRPQHTPISTKIHVRQSKIPENWESLYDGLLNTNINTSANKPVTEQLIFPEVSNSSSEPDSLSINNQHSSVEDKSPSHYQYKGRYIMTAVKSGLMVIDQERAHIRILYERYLDQMKSHPQTPQRVLFPDIVHLTASEQQLYPLVSKEIENLGFELTDMGSGSYAINSVPAGLEGLDAPRVISDMLSVATTQQQQRVSDEIFSSMAKTMARSATIPYGQVLSNDEMEQIVNELFACSNCNYTPDGRKIMCIIKQQEFDHLFS